MSTAPYRLGLTATPERTDGRHADLTWLIGPEVFRRKLADAKHVAPYSIVRVPVQLTPAERDTYDFAARELAAWFADKKKSNKKYEIQDLLIDANFDTEARRVKKLYYTKKSIEDRADEKLRVLEDIFRLHAGERTLVFTGSNAMALDISRRFLLPTILSHSGKTERREVLDGFAKGEFPVLIANEVLDEGVDVPSAKVAVVTGGDTSIRQAKQRLGRILRERGTTKAVLYEIVCDGTSEVARSRKRRKNDAYGRTKHRKI